MRKTRVERIKDKRRAKTEPQHLTGEGLLELMLGGTMTDTQKEFIYDPTEAKAYMGQAGAAKTSTGVGSIMGRALFQPGFKGLIARFDYNKLLDTTMLRAEEMLNRLPPGVLLDRDKSPPQRWWIQPVEKDSDPSQITFMGLKDKPRSYEFHAAFVDEADECDEGVILELVARQRIKDGDKALMLAFNPPAKTHWLYRACTGRDAHDRQIPGAVPWLKLYVPKPRENEQNLADGYYSRLEVIYAAYPDLAARLIYGKWGSVFSGSPVYREFREATHVRTGLLPIHGSPVFRFWDFGYNNPFCIWAQLDPYGRLLILREEGASKIEARPFAERCVAISRAEFPSVSGFIDYGDPAARQHKDTGSTLVHLAQAGVSLRYVISTIESGLKVVRSKFSALIEGEPAVQIDRRCVILIEALKGGYHLDDKGEKPVKDGIYDHPADALRYGFINLWGVSGLQNPLIYGSMNALPDTVMYRQDQDSGLYLPNNFSVASQPEN